MRVVLVNIYNIDYNIYSEYSNVNPSESQVARAGRFGTKGLAITFVSDENDAKILNDVQDRFEVNIGELPDSIDITSYSKFIILTLTQITIIKLMKVSCQNENVTPILR